MDLQQPLDHQWVYLKSKSQCLKRQDRNPSELTGFFCNLEFFGLFGFALFTSYLSLSFFCVSKHGFLSFLHGVRSSGRYERVRVGFLELDKDVGDTGNIFVINSVDISVYRTRIRKRGTRSKKFEEIWGKKVCSGHLGWKILSTSWALC